MIRGSHSLRSKEIVTELVTNKAWTEKTRKAMPNVSKTQLQHTTKSLIPGLKLGSYNSLAIVYAALLGRKTANEFGVLRVGLAAEVYFTGCLTK